MAMVKPALITCLPYIIQTSYQPTTAHYFTMEKCVNVHKSSMEKCDDVSEYSCENVNDVDFDTNMNRDMGMKVML